ncbi:MAG: type II toxin-antitoxin system prevent-host-death family antitoxin [Tabrizicola sp.]|nr:type II toxin-antitoxin system prevent-host-death family antitoxin [Tabrizicola sp.]
MRKVAASEVRARLSKLLTEIGAGETATITRRGKPVAQLVPFALVRPDRLAALQRLQRHGAGLRRPLDDVLLTRNEGRR